MDRTEFRSAWFRVQSSAFNVRIFLTSDLRHPQRALIRVIRAIRGQIPFDLSRGR